MVNRSLAVFAGVLLLAGCTSAPGSVSTVEPTPSATAASSSAIPRTMHILLAATVTGDGEAKVSFSGDPAVPHDASEVFQHSWSHEFDIGYQDWTAINAIQLSVSEYSGADATVNCTIFYDDTVGGARHKSGAFKTATCHLSYGDSGD